ncbi:hypothetical protein J4441_04865 [Candidatus Micrarchaeota archaeon]|nr:hypothetical protein [Candidatus Micrarchaeota archaeon]
MLKIKESLLFSAAIGALAVLVGVLRFSLGINELILACAAVFAGTFAPNIDIPFIHLRRHLKLLVFVVSLALMLYIFFGLDARIIQLCVVEFGQEKCSAGTLILLVVAPFLVATVIDMLVPFKSGPLHGFIPSFLFGAAVFVYLIGTNGLFASAYAGACGFFAYMVHVILDDDRY